MNKHTSIGIMTWYKYQNFGTVLQASALYHVIEKAGYQATMINYPPKSGIVQTEKIDVRYLCKKIVEKVKYHQCKDYTSIGRTQLFEEYQKKHLSETIVCETYPALYELNDSFDAFVCGSDQIWSPLCFDDKYFLPFVEENEKKIAYAPSFGSTKIDNPIIQEKTAKQIETFRHLSVREKQGAELIRNLTGQQAKVVLDPTLLMDYEEWDSLLQPDAAPHIKEGRYIICYFLGDAKRYEKYIQMLSESTGLPYYIIPMKQADRQKATVVPFEVGPTEFVSLIKNSAYVCTDSFHGMAFSINYNKPFSVFKRFADNDKKNQNSRILSLLELLKMQQRLVDPKKDKPAAELLDFDFTYANKLLQEQRAESKQYLYTALEEAAGSSVNQKSKPYKITDLCCGCGTCAAVCPIQAITIQQNKEGFQHYTIDEDKCVRCGKCKTVCPMLHVSAPEIRESKTLYSVKSVSINTLKNSSSGGVGHELVMNALEQQKVVCGCAYDHFKNSAKHIVIMPNQKEKASLLQGSKYIQSQSADAVAEIYRLAKENKVVFFGTPCQAAGMDKLLQSKGLRNQALLVDLICHGVPSQHLWNKYLADLDKNHHVGLHPEVRFRSQHNGWRTMMIMVQGENQTYTKEEHEDDFYAFFRRGLCYLESCSECPYRERSAADLRIGDYWGPRFSDDQTGVSMVIANTEAGKKALQELQEKQKCTIEQHDIEEYWSVQYPYNQRKPLVREQLIEKLVTDEQLLSELRKEYCEYYDRIEKISQIKARIKRMLH